MARTIPSAYTKPSIANVSRGEPVLAADMQSIAQMQNYLYARRGARIGGIVFDSPFETISGVYTVTNSASGGRDLDTWAGVSLPLRRVGASSATYRLDVYGADFDVRCTIKRLDTGATVTTWSVSHDESYGWTTGETSVTLATYAAIPLEFTLEAKFAGADVLCEIFQIHIFETILDADAELPAT